MLTLFLRARVDYSSPSPGLSCCGRKADGHYSGTNTGHAPEQRVGGSRIEGGPPLRTNDRMGLFSRECSSAAGARSSLLTNIGEPRERQGEVLAGRTARARGRGIMTYCRIFCYPHYFLINA